MFPTSYNCSTRLRTFPSSHLLVFTYSFILTITKRPFLSLYVVFPAAPLSFWHLWYLLFNAPVQLPCSSPECHPYGKRQREPNTGWLSWYSLFFLLQTRLWNTHVMPLQITHGLNYEWYMSIFKQENTQEQVVKHTFIMPINIEPMQCIQSHMSKQKTGVEDTSYISIVVFGENVRRME